MVTATQFLAFHRTGDRQAYEKPYFARRVLLMGAALAECAEDSGRYLDAVIDGIWCVPGGKQLDAQRPQRQRPSRHATDDRAPPARYGKSLRRSFCGANGGDAADILYLLEDKLDAVSPLIARRVRSEVGRRVIVPFLTHDDFWWMGMIRHNVNNWTPWIVSNVIDVLLLLERDAYRRSAGVARAMRMLDSYIAVLPSDGGCDEGAGYFNMRGAALFDALQSVYTATGGRVSFYHEPLIRRIAAFPAACAY